MTHLELREKFFQFWKEAPRNHVKIPSSSLVPENDPTTLFTGSGMQPLIPYLLGEPHPLGKRLVNIQKCFRGQDIDAVGDNRHDTFFEMMGNWSLGDYFKDEQIAWYFEFMTKILGFDLKNFYIGCFAGSKEAPKDEESAKVWISLGIPKNRIYYYGVENNWWSRSGTPAEMPIGEIGGPDTELFYDFGTPHNPKFGKDCHPNCECGRFLELGNSVFIQYQKQPDGSFKELPQKNVDFGGGLERTLAATQNDPDIFKTDLYVPIIKKLEKISGTNYGNDKEIDRSFRVIADHLKAAVFLADEKLAPSNKDRGYIMRRLIRRAARFGKKINIDESFLGKIVDQVVEIYQLTYPDLETHKNFIKVTLMTEENNFRTTLERGLKEFERIGNRGRLNAQEVFYLFESFGFPYELIQEESRLKKIAIATKEEYDQEFKKHQEQSRTASQGKFKGGLADHSDQVVKYHTTTHLLHAALREVLGDHVHQEGSNITAERLRFDFSHPTKLTPEEIKKVEDLINAQIAADLPRKIETMTYDEAIKSGTLAFLKERYPEKVTVYSFGPSTGSGQAFSREICGGPHVEHTNLLGKFKIIKEESVAAGTRRIYGQISEH